MGRLLRRHVVEIALGALVVTVVGLMIVPLPTWLLDVLLATNLTLSVILLLTALFVRRALSFGALPTILLVTTLFRLALNVSSTRLILLQADAGRVISAFGDFVVSGNYVVGAVVFLVITLIQFVVIARGSERVAEVGARFTLDAMPGKQLAIDADLRAGVLDAELAAERRAALQRESQFYGAMDGAMKFVKGDAIASLAIVAVNLIGGLAVGVGMRDLDASEALELYGLLTIGDGLVSQIPALLISTAAGLVVTRVASDRADGTLGTDIGAQVFGDWRALAVAAVFAGLLAIVPGLPAAPFAVLAVLVGLGAWARSWVAPDAALAAPELGPPRSSALEIHAGKTLLAAARSERALEERLGELAAVLYGELGVRLPVGPALLDGSLDDDGFVVELGGARAASGAAADVDALVAAVAEAARRRPALLLGLEETQRELDRLGRQAPALVRTVVPGTIELPRLAGLLRGLLAEGVSVRPLREILEAVAAGPVPEAEDALLAAVRRRLARPMTQALAQGGALRARPVDPLIEEAIREALVDGEAPALAPDLAEDILGAAQRAHEKTPDAVLLTQPDVRRGLWRLLSPELPSLRVLSYRELDPEVPVERLEPLGP